MWFLGGILSPWVYDPNFFLKYLYKAVAVCAMSKNWKSIQMSVTQHYSLYLCIGLDFIWTRIAYCAIIRSDLEQVYVPGLQGQFIVKNILLSESCCEIVDVNKWHKIDTAMTLPINT